MSIPKIAWGIFTAGFQTFPRRILGLLDIQSSQYVRDSDPHRLQCEVTTGTYPSPEAECVFGVRRILVESSIRCQASSGVKDVWIGVNVLIVKNAPNELMR